MSRHDHYTQTVTNDTEGPYQVSDSASTDPSLDKSGPVLADIFHAASDPENQFTVEATQIVSDDFVRITEAVQESVAKGVDWIVTSGGTGFGQRDGTPEACRVVTSPKTEHLLGTA